MNVVLIMLAGMGDLEVFLIPEEAYTWMQSVRPGPYRMPQNIIDALQPFRSAKDNDRYDNEDDAWAEMKEEGQYATGGTYTNDVAIQLSCLVHGYDSVTDAFTAINRHDWILVEEYHGGIY